MTIPFDSPNAARVFEAVRRLAKSGRLRASTLSQKLPAQTGLGAIEIAEGLRELHRRALLRYDANARGQPVSGYVELDLEKEPPLPHELNWLTALSSAEFDAETISALIPMGFRLAGMTAPDIVTLAGCLASLQKAARLSSTHPLESGFNVSARSIMGSAKVISFIPAKAMAALGLDPSLQTPSPRYVIHAGPTQGSIAEATLLIENPQAFENAVAAGLCEHMSLVCTFGFAISYLGQPKLLHAECLAHERPIVLQRCGQCRDLADIFSARTIYFWGDLDVAALKIFLACRSIAPSLQLSAIYASMEHCLDIPARSHPYSEMYDKAGQIRMTANVEANIGVDPYTARLFARCSDRGVDQEVVDVQEIARYGRLAYADVCNPLSSEDREET